MRVFSFQFSVFSEQTDNGLLTMGNALLTTDYGPRTTND